MDVINSFISEEPIFAIPLFTFFTIILVYLILTYILYVLGLFRIAQSKKLKCSWLAFIPILNIYTLGKTVNPIKYGNKEISNTPILLLSIYVVYILIKIIFSIVPYLAIFNFCLSPIFDLIIFIIFLMVYYRLYQQYTHNSILYTVLSVDPGIKSLLVFFIRNNDPEIKKHTNTKEIKITILILFVILMFTGITTFIFLFNFSQNYKQTEPTKEMEKIVQKIDMEDEIDEEIVESIDLDDDTKKICTKDYLIKVVEEKVIEQLQIKEDIEITDKDIQEAYDGIADQVGGEEALDQNLEMYGMTQSELKDQLVNELVMEKIIAPTLEYTEEDLAEFFEQNKEFIYPDAEKISFEDKKDEIERFYIQQEVNEKREGIIRDFKEDVEEGALFRGSVIELDCYFEFLVNNRNNLLAGKFTSGKFKDYYRIIVDEWRYLSSFQYILATKDWETYFIHNSEDAQYQMEFGSLGIDDTIIEAVSLDTEHLEQITLDNNFILYMSHFIMPEDPINEFECNTLNSLEEFKLCWIDLRLNLDQFNRNDIRDSRHRDLLGATTPYDIKKIRDKYLLGSTKIIVEDSIGLKAVYTLTTPEKISINEKENKDSMVFKPTLGFTKDQIKTTQKLEFYESYEKALWAGQYVFDLNNSVVNIPDEDLIQIGSVYNLPLYHLKNTNHDLYKLQYKVRVAPLVDYPEVLDIHHPNIVVPNFEEYVNKNPLLFIKDYWNRWIVLGEFDLPRIQTP